MTIRGFFIFTFVQWVFFTALKFIFFNYTVTANPGLEALLYWALNIVLAAAMIRRLGVINFFECIFIILLWTLGDALSDLLLLTPIFGVEIFAKTALWAGYGFQALGLFMFHKKRHLEIRREQHAHHNSHGHH